ncbi:MAG: 23S rRNA (pseudouridine(1915)-N(3))-methyltransferase RlmH [Proteobacteria bacterium]|nr:MAG: 23S rRNA (pseudouridine(1915)-N(3))-methyltransferase RlmH [Pseudomonadota bacterium]
MILRLLHPGGAGKGPLGDAAADYRARLSRRLRAEELYVKASRQRDRARALAEEADRMRAVTRPRDRLVALVIGERPWSSEDLATRLQRWMGGGYGAVCFLLGSADGLAPQLARQAHERWSFGPMTLPHDLARVVLWEQLYRASTIVHGEPYHTGH